MLKNFSIAPLENSGGAEKLTEYSGSHVKNFFCSMYEMSQRHPLWVTENRVNPCNSVAVVDGVAWQWMKCSRVVDVSWWGMKCSLAVDEIYCRSVEDEM